MMLFLTRPGVAVMKAIQTAMMQTHFPPRSARLGDASAKKTRPGRAGKATAAEKLCFLSGCEEKKSSKHKHCSLQKKVFDAILYQADKAGRRAEVEKILADPVLAAKAVRDFEAENPPGRFRNKLIDFTVWLKTYSTETAQTSRDILELYTFQDFSDEKTAAGWDAAAILNKWQQPDSDPAVDREDDGSLWLPKRKQRLQDTTKRITQSVIESSKNMKALKPQDVEDLKLFATASLSGQHTQPSSTKHGSCCFQRHQLARWQDQTSPTCMRRLIIPIFFPPQGNSTRGFRARENALPKARINPSHQSCGHSGGNFKNLDVFWYCST